MASTIFTCWCRVVDGKLVYAVSIDVNIANGDVREQCAGLAVVNRDRRNKISTRAAACFGDQVEFSSVQNDFGFKEVTT